MFKDDYNFFDYKYNISGYNGNDYGGLAQYIYLSISIILLISLLIYLRKTPKEKVLKIIKYISIFMVLFYLTKTTWESVYDIKKDGAFNTGLLPLDSCSIIMVAGLITSFSKSKIKDYSTCWLATGGLLGGLATMVRLNAFKYYPFFTFGAFYSMIWHFLMVFIGLLIIITNYTDISYKTIIKGFIFHLVFSLIVIPIDFIYDLDFMMYHYLGSIPFLEEVGTTLISKGLVFLNPLIMLLVYYLGFNLIFIIPLIIKKYYNYDIITKEDV